MNLRLDKLLIRLSQAKIDGLLVSRDANVSYLCGFESADSWMLVTPKKSFYITDFRYVQQVKNDLKYINLFQYKQNIFKGVFGLCRDLKIKRLGFEANGLSYGQYKKLKNTLASGFSFKATSNLVEDLRQIKEPVEIEKIRQSLKLTKEAFEFLKTVIKPGAREMDIATELEYFIRQGGGKLAFAPIIASGINSVYPHAKITSKKIAKNEAITVDIGIDFDGYKSDLTRVFFLGKIPLFCKKIYKIILEAQAKVIKEIAAGQPAKKIDALARNHIKQKGLGRFFGHSLGHGVGLEVHEAPRISATSKVKIEKGMVLTVEPGIYIPGKFGVRIEDMVLVKEKGCEVLSGFIHKSN
ncbi:MAG: Xaa-Pro peptidase family protein [Candidatus Omnitrophota bacterium]|nr:Xaa-Pro peptidase family protein [Candidatus Omnitrophota bacterium]